MVGGDFRGGALVVPEPRRVHLLFEPYEPLLECDRVKGTHGPSRAGPRARRAVPRAASVVPRSPRHGSEGLCVAAPLRREPRERLQAPPDGEPEAELDEPRV